MHKLGSLSLVCSRPATNMLHQHGTRGHPWKEPRPNRFGNDALLGGGGGVGWTEKPQVMYMEILTGEPAPGVFVSPKTAEGNCRLGLASAGSPAIVTGDLEEPQHTSQMATPALEVFCDSTI